MIAVMAASRKFSIQILVEQFPLCDQTFVKKILFATESYKQLRPISVIRLDVHNRVIFLLEKRPAKEFISSDNGQTVLLKKIRLIINFEMKLSRMPVVTANWLIGNGRHWLPRLIFWLATEKPQSLVVVVEIPSSEWGKLLWTSQCPGQSKGCQTWLRPLRWWNKLDSTEPTENDPLNYLDYSTKFR